MWQTTTQIMCKEILSTLFPSQESPKVSVKFFVASTVEEASFVLRENQIHLFLLDKDLGTDSVTGKRINGVDHIPEFKSLQPLCQILMLTADHSVKDITRAMRNGASDYLFKSSDEEHREHRTEIIRRSLQHYAEQLRFTKQAAPGKIGLYSNYVSKSPAMQRLDNKLHAFGETQRPVLLLGATGLGKGAVARRMNELRRIELNQKHREFVQINIAATEKNMVESILFGTEPGAFTDASKQTKPGLLDAARGGDLFLDEIGDASLDLQLKLLKVVEEKEYYRVGGNKPIKTDARFILATNKDPQTEILAGRFREDFYMRISVFEETLPPLSERKEDIPLIIKGFLEAACAETRNKRIQFEDLPSDLLNYFMRDEIPGNIRGIENDVARLVAHIPIDGYGKAQLQHWRKILGNTSQVGARRSQLLGTTLLSTAKTNFLDDNFPGLPELREMLERRVLEEVEAKGWNLDKASKVLKVSINTIWARKKQFKIETKEQTL